MVAQEWALAAEHPPAAPSCDAAQSSSMSARKVSATGVNGILPLGVAMPFAPSVALLRSGPFRILHHFQSFLSITASRPHFHMSSPPPSMPFLWEV